MIHKFLAPHLPLAMIRHWKLLSQGQHLLLLLWSNHRLQELLLVPPSSRKEDVRFW
jgi:hypothetical protein